MAKAQGNMTGAVEALNKYLETYALPIHFVPWLSFAHCHWCTGQCLQFWSLQTCHIWQQQRICRDFNDENSFWPSIFKVNFHLTKADQVTGGTHFAGSWLIMTLGENSRTFTSHYKCKFSLVCLQSVKRKVNSVYGLIERFFKLQG